MKPIEIHIEGYKIVISKEDEDKITVNKKAEENIITYPVYPTQPEVAKYPYVTWYYEDKNSTGDWWRYPFQSWISNEIVVNTNTE